MRIWEVLPRNRRHLLLCAGHAPGMFDDLERELDRGRDLAAQTIFLLILGKYPLFYLPQVLRFRLKFTC